MSSPTGGFLNWLKAEDVDPQSDLAKVAFSVYMQESGGGKNTKTSNQDAHGGMQIIPGTFKSYADKDWDINDPEHNGRTGIRYLKDLHQKSGGVPELTATGYYSGEGGMRAAMKGERRYDAKNPTAPDSIEYGQEVWARANGLPLPKRVARANQPAGGAAPEPVQVARAPSDIPSDIQNSYVEPAAPVALAQAPAARAPIAEMDPWTQFQATMPRRELAAADLNYGVPPPSPMSYGATPSTSVAGAVPPSLQPNFAAFQSWMPRARQLARA